MTNEQKVIAWMGLGFTLIGIATVGVYIYNKTKEKNK